MACLQIYWELLSLATFFRVYSNSEEVSYLSCQNTYLNLKTTCHIKLKLFLWTRLPKEHTPCKMSYVAAALTYWFVLKEMMIKDIIWDIKEISNKMQHKNYQANHLPMSCHWFLLTHSFPMHPFSNPLKI